MSKFSKLLLMIKMLENDQIKTKDIAAELGVSQRMIRKYVKDIKEAGMDIESRPGPTGGYYIEKPSKESLERGYKDMEVFLVRTLKKKFMELHVMKINHSIDNSKYERLEKELEDQIKALEEQINMEENYGKM